MQIRSAQLSEFADLQRERANQKLIEYLRHRYPAKFAEKPDSQLARFASYGRSEAKRYGIVREDSLATYLDLWIMYGADFPLAEWAVDVMTCDALHGPDKMSILRHRIVQSGVDL